MRGVPGMQRCMGSKAMKIIVHIGLHKTGTTSIQFSLAENRGKLLDQGILYPRAAAVEAGGHLNLVWEATQSWKFTAGAGGLAELIAEARSSDAEVVLISAESLSGYSKSQAPLEIIGTIQRELNADIEVVCTIRPQFVMLDSLYAQNASTGYTRKSFEDYATEVMNRQLLDFEFLLGRWFERFGEVRIIAVEPGSSVSLEDRFLSAVGLQRSVPLETATRVNLRPSARVVEYCRAAGAIFSSLKMLPLRKRAALRLIREAVESEFPGEPAFSGLTKGFASLINDYYKPRNVKFRSDRLGGARLFARSPADYHFDRCVMRMNDLRGTESLRFAEMVALAIEETR